MTPFDILKHITDPGGNARLLDVEETYHDYKKNMFMINRGLAQTIDTVMFAQEANKGLITDPDMHFGLMFHGIKKRKRWAAWAKKAEDVDNLDKVMEFYQVNRDRALEYMKLLSEEELKNVVASFDPGGADKPKVTKPKKK